jgi:hypothetical protein
VRLSYASAFSSLSDCLDAQLPDQRASGQMRERLPCGTHGRTILFDVGLARTDCFEASIAGQRLRRRLQLPTATADNRCLMVPAGLFWTHHVCSSGWTSTDVTEVSERPMLQSGEAARMSAESMSCANAATPLAHPLAGGLRTPLRPSEDRMKKCSAPIARHRLLAFAPNKPPRLEGAMLSRKNQGCHRDLGDPTALIAFETTVAFGLAQKFPGEHVGSVGLRPYDNPRLEP